MNKKATVSNFILGFVKVTGFIAGAVFFKPKKYYESDNCKKRLKGPCILMSNHTSLLDFPLYLLVFPFSTIRFWMAEVLFNKGKLFSWFLFKLGGIYINRNAYDTSFIEESLSILDKNGIIGVFPQGRLPVKGKSFPFKPGIVLVASKTDAPIIPVYTDGNYGLFKRTHVIIGEPIYLQKHLTCEKNEREEIEKLTAMLEEKNYELKDKLERLLCKNEKEQH